MKKLVLAVLSLLMIFAGNQSFAQGKYGADSAECIKYLSYYKEYFKQMNYTEAIPSWRKAFKLCPPTAQQTYLLDGTTLVRRLITENAKNEAYKNALIDTLLTLHSLRAQYYPTYAVTALNNKGLDIANYIKGDSKRLFDSYNEIIDANKNQTKAQIFLFAMNAAIDLYQKGNLTAEDVISTYQKNMEYISKVKAANPTEQEQNDKIKTDLESLFISSKVASCDNLIALFSPRYEANPNDNELVSNIVKMMSSTEDCTSNDLYLKAVTSMYKNEPSYNSAYFLYRLNASRGNVQDAVKYMEEAIAYPESDDKQDGEYYYELATFLYKNSMTAKAFESANKAVTLNPDFAGKAYFLMGTIWGATNCGGDEISRRAPYWVAVDYMIKARNADPSLAEDASKLIGQYSAYYPQTAEAFMYDITDGQSYTVACGGMRATTTVRTQK